jgi:hypothetical protein
MARIDHYEDPASKLAWEAFPAVSDAAEWRVEACDTEGDGSCYVTIFAGRDAESRARKYAAWMSG